MSTINGKSNTLGTYQLYFGDFNKMYTAPEAYDQVTLDDIQRVTKKYLIKANRTVGILDSAKDSNDGDL